MIEERRDERLALARRPRIDVHDVGDQARVRFAAECRRAGQHLVEHAAECPDIAPRVRVAAFDLLGSHVLKGAEDRALLRERRRHGRRDRHHVGAGAERDDGRRLGEPEIQQLRVR